MTSSPPNAPEVQGFYHEPTGSIQYVVADPITLKCAIIDPVLDFDRASARTSTSSADAILKFIADRDYRVEWILDTHPHADHFSAASYLKAVTGAPTAIGSQVIGVQKLWAELYALPASFRTDGSQWDHLFENNETFHIGAQECRVLSSPGHTLASVTYLVEDAAFIHDTLFMPDSGTARADFPGASPEALWRTIQDILELPDDTRLFCGHDYRPGGRPPLWQSTVAEQRSQNIHLTRAGTCDEFIALRRNRDRQLPLPDLMLYALQVNIAGGRLPLEEDNKRCFLKIPINVF